MTKREFLVKTMELEGCTDEMREVAEKMIASLDKKSSKPTKVQVANEGIKADILAILADGRARTATEIGTEIGISCQKASALIRPLVADKTVTKIEAKGKNPTRFVVAE